MTDNKDFNDSKLSDLYQHSATEKSPKGLDNLILAQAKANCEAPFVQNRTSRRNWMFGFSTAAVVVIGFSVVMNSQISNDKAMLPIKLEETVALNAKKGKKTSIDDKASQDEALDSEIIPTVNGFALSELSKEAHLKPKRKATAPEKQILSVAKPEEESEEVPIYLAEDELQESASPVAPSAGAIINNDYSIQSDEQDKVELERVITTGTHIRASDLNDGVASELEQEIKNLIVKINNSNERRRFKNRTDKLSKHLKRNKIKKAQELLKHIMVEFNYLDFEELELLINKL